MVHDNNADGLGVLIGLGRQKIHGITDTDSDIVIGGIHWMVMGHGLGIGGWYRVLLFLFLWHNSTFRFCIYS